MIDAAKLNPSETLGRKTLNDSPPSVFELFKIRMLKKLTGRIKQMDNKTGANKCFALVVGQCE
jgi:hypothetical protein